MSAENEQSHNRHVIHEEKDDRFRRISCVNSPISEYAISPMSTTVIAISIVIRSFFIIDFLFSIYYPCPPKSQFMMSSSQAKYPPPE